MQNSQRLYPALLVFLIVLTILEGWWPWVVPDYPVGFWFLTYEHGLLRRGLIGTLLAGFDLPSATTLRLMLVIHAAAMAALAALLWWRARDMLRLADDALRDGLFLLLALLLSSQLMAILAHNNSYFDVYLLLLMAGCFELLRAGKQRVWIWGLAAVGIAIHELFLFLWVPVVLTSFLIKRPLSWSLIFWPLAVYLALVVGEGENVREALNAIALGDFYPRVYWRDVYGLSISTIVPDMASLILSDWPRVALAGLLFALPGALGGFVAAHAVKTEREKLLCFIVALAPMGALLVGWDMSRFFTMTTVTSLLLLTALAKTQGAVSSALTCSWLKRTLMALLAFNLLTPGLMDNFDGLQIMPGVPWVLIEQGSFTGNILTAFLKAYNGVAAHHYNDILAWRP